MRAVTLSKGEYIVQDCATPEMGEEEVCIQVAYAGINRADLLQKQGRYPLPQSAVAIPGLEVAGNIIACGKKVRSWKPGNHVCALMAEGAFAEYAIVPATLLLPVPPNVPLDHAACLPEAFFTAWISLVWQGRLKSGQSVLIHGGASGIGTIAIQIAKNLGAYVYATAGSEKKCALCEQLGAKKAIYYKKEDFVQIIAQMTGGRGVNLILDMVGGDYLPRNLSCLAHGGSLCIIAFLQGARSDVNMAPVLLKHLRIMGSTLRSRPLHEKEQLREEVQENLWIFIENGSIKPVIDSIFSLEGAALALERMEQGLNLGKILLRI